MNPKPPPSEFPVDAGCVAQCDAVAATSLVHSQNDKLLREDAQRIQHWLTILVELGQVVELLAFDVDHPGCTIGGFFDTDHLSTMAQAALILSGRARGVYFSLNPLRSELLARSPNRVRRFGKGDAAGDDDVLRRRWLFIDGDPVRLGTVAATDAEKEKARLRIMAVHSYLKGLGWPSPVLADSGNGYHLLYAVDLPVNDGGMVRRVLHALASRFDDAQVKIDTKVFNPARIDKLYGTESCKGEATRERPHRWTSVLEIPEPLRPVSMESLTTLANHGPFLPMPEPSKEGPGRSASKNQLRLSDRQTVARSYLGKMPAAVEGHGGDKQTFAVACTLVVDFDLSIEEALPLLREYNRRCQPPWAETDLLHKLHEANQKPGVRGRLTLRSPDAHSLTDAPIEEESEVYSGSPFLGTVPDFVLADWERALPPRSSSQRPGLKKRGRKRIVGGLPWLVHHAVIIQRRSEVAIPDIIAAQVVWGAERNARPRNWHQFLFKCLKRGFKRVTVERACRPDCPLLGGLRRHQHFVVRVPDLGTCDSFAKTFLLRLERYGHTDEQGVRTYDWMSPQLSSPERTEDLRHVINDDRKSGRVGAVYLPALLFGPSPRCKLTFGQQRLLIALTRELTRHSRSAREDKAHVSNATKRDSDSPRRNVPPYLPSGNLYVGFNGNGKYQRRGRRGRGYRLVGRTRSGWLAKAGYLIPEDGKQRWLQVRQFMKDLRGLAADFGLFAGGWHPEERRWLPLEDLIGMTRSPAGRQWLTRCLVRVYTPDDYLARWRGHFAARMGFSIIAGGKDTAEPNTKQKDRDQIRSAVDLELWMRRHGLTDQGLADQLKVSRSWVSAQRSGRRSWSKHFQDQLDAWVAAQFADQAPAEADR